MARKNTASSKSFGGVIAVVAVAGIAALGYVMSRPAKVLTLDAAMAPVNAAGVLRGDTNALVQVIEFADFECPGCGYFANVNEPDVVARLIETGEISFRFMDFPLEGHRNTVPAHNAAACANEQGKFWEMHDAIFANQDRWNAFATQNPKSVLKEIAQMVGLDVGEWEDCYDSGRMLPQIAANRDEGRRLGVRGTPTFIINGRTIVSDGVPTYDQFRDYVTQAKVAAMAAASESASKAP